MDDMRNRYRGCLVGGAVGDALGYPVEFISYAEILARYGSQGIQDYDLVDGKALITDDTQMALFTAFGMLYGQTRQCLRGISGPPSTYIWRAYLDWLLTQDTIEKVEKASSWLLRIPELWHQRAPGATCLSALRGDVPGTMETPINNSKGCGGIMRVPPIALFCAQHHVRMQGYELEDVPPMLAAEVAALTHGHPLGFIPAAALALLIHGILMQNIPGDGIAALVHNCMIEIRRLFIQYEDTDAFITLTQKAITLAGQDIPDIDAIQQLGEGWVAEETFAIAVYCCCKYSGSLEKAIVAAVNHDGDSDSTGAVTGNIMGALVGLDSIPAKYTNTLELIDSIIEMADDLYDGCQVSEYSGNHDEKWLGKYVYAD